jgi:hypothetical protein
MNMLQIVEDKEKCRKLLIWLLRRRKYIDELLDPEDLNWKIGDQILAWIVGSRSMEWDDFVINRAIGKKKKKRRRKMNMIEYKNPMIGWNMLFDGITSYVTDVMETSRNVPSVTTFKNMEVLRFNTGRVDGTEGQVIPKIFEIYETEGEMAQEEWVHLSLEKVDDEEIT